MKDLKYIFVHGLSGWGSYDERYKTMPYWGMRDGDLMEKLRKDGYLCYAASVNPYRSAYDRACELYAQLAGKITDYGKNHAEKYQHDQFGPDFTNRPLIENFDDSTKLVLIGHSFGGATIRLFAHMMAYGNPEENNSESPLFEGGMQKRIHTLVAIAAPHNGTTAYDLYEDPDFDISAVSVPKAESVVHRLKSAGTSVRNPSVPYEDLAAYDMHIDNALELNRKLKLSENTYYFSQPCSASERKGNIHVPIAEKLEILNRRNSRFMGAYNGKTAKGYILDENWQENDGLVNTVSSTYPFEQPHQDFDENNIPKGVWNVFPVYPGDHMALQGGFFQKRRIYPYYKDLLALIEKL